MTQIEDTDYEGMLAEIAAYYYDDPHGFMLAAFPFGEPGTPLEHSQGLEKWQAEVCRRITAHIRSGTEAPFRHSCASGHGIGKSAFVSMLIHWFMVTREGPGTAGRVTANTATQLLKTTWSELSKWHQLSIFAPWFEKTATRYFKHEQPDTWRVDAVTWSEENTIAFQGLHGKAVLVIYDEASGIPKKIWEVTEGAMTEAGAFWLAFGNPNKSSDMFYETFRPDSGWQTMHVDSRDVSWITEEYAEAVRKQFGEDAYKVRVLGQFPDNDLSQFLTGASIEMAYDRGMWAVHEEDNVNLPLALGVDVARFGIDETVITGRRGHKLPIVDRRQGLDTYQTATLVESYIKRYRPVVVNVDVVGVGAGVVDYLRNAGYRNLVFGVNGGAKPAQGDRYYNLRAEMWDRGRDWVTHHGQLLRDNPDHVQMLDEAVAVLFQYTDSGQLKLERKAEMVKRVGFSPNVWDSFAMTFARRIPVVGSTNNFQPVTPQVIF